MPPITEEGQSQEEGNDHVRRLEEGNGTTRMTGGGPDTGPGTMSGPRRGEALSVPAPQLHLPPPPSEVPDWSDGEAMPLIIIETSSVPPGAVITKSGQNRPFSGYAGGRKFVRCVSRHSGISHATGGGQCAAGRYNRTPAS